MPVHETCQCSVEDKAAVTSALKEFEPISTNLIPILHRIQDETGRLTRWAMEQVANELKIPLAEVWGTATFYTMFDLEGAAKHIVRVCDSPPCHITGAQDILNEVIGQLGIKPGEVTPDGLFGLEVVSCFGVCGVAPAIIVDQQVFGNLTPTLVGPILAKYRED